MPARTPRNARTAGLSPIVTPITLPLSKSCKHILKPAGLPRSHTRSTWPGGRARTYDERRENRMKKLIGKSRRFVDIGRTEAQDKTAAKPNDPTETMLIANERDLHGPWQRPTGHRSCPLSSRRACGRPGRVRSHELLVNGLEGFQLTKWDIVNPRVTRIDEDGDRGLCLDGRGTSTISRSRNDPRVNRLDPAQWQVAGVSSPADGPRQELEIIGSAAAAAQSARSSTTAPASPPARCS